MPRDFAVDTQHQLIQVHEGSGAGLPFSRGIMATSILATGLETSVAYRIAADIHQRLLDQGVRGLPAQDLADIAVERIDAMAGSAAAARYRAWRKARRTGRPIVLCLSGAAGVGKSTFATRLALRLGIHRVVPTDAIREVLRTVIPDTVLPELHRSTYESRADENGVDPGDVRTADGEAADSFLRQARAVSAATAAVAHRLVTERRSVILEGVHLLPGDVAARFETTSSEAIVVERLLTLDDVEHHRAQLLRRARTEPGRDGQRHLDHLRRIRNQQAELRRLAARAGVAEHDITHPEDLTQRIVDDIVELAEPGMKLSSVMA